MENHVEKFGRFSSCRGVAFEIKPHPDLFAINHPPSSGSKKWVPWGSNNSRIEPSRGVIQRSISKASSHFCDIDVGDIYDYDDDSSTDIEEGREDDEKVAAGGQSPLPLIPSASKRDQLPKPNKPKQPNRLKIMLLDQGLFTVYKRLFVVCLTLNITALVLAATGKFSYARNHAVLFSLGNILALILCRSEAFLRVVFWLTVKILGHSWVPLRLKTMATALLQSLGGIHSSCGVSSLAWFIYALCLTLKDRDNTSEEIVAVASASLFLLLLSSLAAFPLVRHLHHNVFERTHRFAGWTALILVWAFIILTISYDPQSKSYSSNDIGSKLIKQEEFWFTLGITVLILLPWITVRRVPVHVSSASSHASIIRFNGGVKPGILGRISPSPLSEWHAFGIISDGKDQHMMLAGAVGDYTKSLVANPPSHLWVRKVHFVGLPYLINMYDRMLLVSTGSGICVFLSFLLQPCRANVCFLWVTKGVEQNFGKEIKGWMSGHPNDKVIVHDTAILGRPNVSQMSVDAAKKWGAEVVFVTSNPEGSRDVVDACKAAGIPAFAPVWDS